AWWRPHAEQNVVDGASRIGGLFESTVAIKKARATEHLSPAREDTRSRDSRPVRRKLEDDLDFSLRQA
ncbi:MAG: hypothetical protein WCB74_23380, partial [Pseudolabrys sp.]